MIYLDSSALVKRVVTEVESEALERYLKAHADQRLVSSGLASTEVVRAVLHRGYVSVERARAIVIATSLIPLAGGLLRSAATLKPVTLRSLDAIHLASALRLGEDLTAFVGYDRRLLNAAAALGLPVASPV